MLTTNPPESTTHNLGAGTGIPAPVVDELLSALSSGLRALRSDFADRSEQVVAAEWRGGFRDRAVHLDDIQTYLMITQAMYVCLDVLAATEAARRAEFLEQVAGTWWSAVLDPQQKEPDDYGDSVMRSFDQLGIPRPRQSSPLDIGAPRVAVLGVIASIHAMHRCLGAGLLDDRTMAMLRVLCVAGQAVNAPERVWEYLVAGARVPEPAVVGPAEWPNDLTSAIVGAELRLRATMAATNERYNRLNRADPEIRAELNDRRLSSASESLLGSVGVNLANLRTLVARRHEYDRAGLLKKLAIGSGDTLMAQECARIKRQWVQQLDAARAACGHANATRDYAIDGYAEQVAAYEPGQNSRLDDWLRPLRGYFGDKLAELGFRRVPHTLWTIKPVEDRPWQLPQLANLHPNVVVFTDEQAMPYQQGCSAARNLVLDKMSRAAPGGLVLTWIDPIGRGQSAGPFLELLEIDKTLIDQKVWSEPDEITAALRRVSDRMAMLEQRCLKDTFPDLDSYNETAGSLAEPYHVVVVTGFPRGFTDETAQRLKQITEQGARLGISVITVLEPGMRQELRATTTGTHRYPQFTVPLAVQHSGLPSWWSRSTFPDGLWVAGHEGKPHARVAPHGEKDVVYAPCSFIEFEPAAAGAIVSGYATAAVNAADVRIDSTGLLSAEDGDGPPETTTHSVDIPLGTRGRGGQVELRLGKDLSQNVLVGGLPGSGKSTLFHTLITTAARRYSPRELEMYLLDFKQGVEFQPYADGALPHARVVAVQSEREFGLSVLRGLRDEITSRSKLFRAINADSLAEYRERRAEQQQPHVLPRVLVVVDEFQMMFAEEDAVADECAKLLDHIVRQGRAFGLHIVLGTQTLRGQGTMSMLRGTLDQVAVRIVLKTGESDSRLFLADDNPAGVRLTRPGEAIFNPDGGRPEGNLEFQVAFTDDDARDEAMRRARKRADDSGFTRRPLVFDGTRTITVDEDEQVADWVAGRSLPDGKSIRLHLGLPVAIGGSGAIALSLRGGRNLAIVHREGVITSGSALVGIVTAVHSSAVTPRISIVECLGNDEDHADDLAQLAGWREITWGTRRKALRSTLAEAAAEVSRRVDADDFRSQPWLIVINAVQRARELDPEPSFDDTGSPHEDLMAVLADGSDVGVHVIVTADSVEGFDRRLGPRALAQFGARLIGQCSEDASHRVLGSGAASRLGPAYALLDEPDDNRRQTLRPFPMPDPSWVRAAISDREEHL